MKTSHTRRLAIACILVVLLSGCRFLPDRQQQSSTPSKDALLTIVSQSPQAALPLPSSFIGMNIELGNICAMLRTDVAHRQAYEQLFENFGTGTLHIGGRSADEGVWEPNGRAVCLSSRTVVTKSLVKAVFAFAHRIHWNVIWGLNFLINNPSMIASEAADVASVGGSTLKGFSIGNEPELFVRYGERPAGWGYNDYLTEWKADSAAVQARVPAARFFGPEACCNQKHWFSSFLQQENDDSLAAASRHYYYYTSAHATAANLTPLTLLSPQAMQHFTSAAQSWVAEADREGLPVDITEINSISNGGIAGVSNTFGAALWASDILFQSALIGIHQLDFQQVPHASYAFINAQAVPQIIYYGLLFFRLATVQASFLPDTLNTTANVSAYVLKGRDGTLRIVVISKEAARGMTIVVQPGAAYHKMTTLRMQAPSLAATSGTPLNGVGIGNNGTWTAPSLTSEQIQSGQVTLNVPASSAALFTFSM